MGAASAMDANVFDEEFSNEDNTVNKFLFFPQNAQDRVSPLEIHWTLRKYFANIPQRVSILLAKLADEDQDGNISRSEFNKFALKLQAVTDDEDIFDIIFTAADLNHNNKIDQKEMDLICDKLNLKTKLVQKEISKVEFQLFMQPFVHQITGCMEIPFESELLEELKEDGIMIDAIHQVPVQSVQEVVRAYHKNKFQQLEMNNEPQLNQTVSLVRHFDAKQNQTVLQQSTVIQQQAVVNEPAISQPAIKLTVKDLGKPAAEPDISKLSSKFNDSQPEVQLTRFENEEDKNLKETPDLTASYTVKRKRTRKIVLE
ncbi:EF-hand_domain pair [Hexamita inflata]|uniref:EF-hand domain pair n=1 Tax=Hexamita inflata TaxID=28002 RepID=A0AA86TX30_9EUKA|nr:EF-hand domain pair [Hexamita inflata]